MSLNQKNIFSFIRYSNCWEDSSALRKALKIKSGQRGISIASAGDNSLSLLLDDPSEIIAFDLNETQLFCVELKMAAFKTLSYSELLEFLGVRESNSRLTMYQSVKKHMSAEATAYFDSNLSLIERGIIHVGKFEHYFQLFKKYVIPLFTSRKKINHFMQMDDPKEQARYYKDNFDNKRLHFLFGIYFGKEMMGKLGRDKSFFKYVEDSDNVAVRIKKRFELGVSNVPNNKNPYLSYILRNEFGEGALPEYLKQENFDIIRERIDRITLFKGDLLSIPADKYDFFNLSDIFEYMSDAQFEQNVNYISQIAAPNGRIAYWNMQGSKYVNDRGLTCQKELSEQLFVEDRAFFYKDFLVYIKENV